MKAFERYRPLIDHWSDFCHISRQPLPTCIWTNTLRLSPARLAEILTADGLAFEPLSWAPGAFQLAADFKPGYHWAFLAGLYQIQEAVSLLPVLWLEPEPGQRILDLCAAPGNKTAQIAVKMGNRGTVVANDLNAGRLRAARQTQERLGLVNVTTTVADGGNYPPGAGVFDSVLVDVPCSCEGTSRKEPGVLERVSVGLSLKRSGGQKALLRKAVQLCKPGGRIVYSTCTYAPEENEVVVDAVLRQAGEGRLRLIPAQVTGLSTSPGLTEWQGRRLHPSLAGSMRVWPHQNNTGGFFIAVLQKSLDASPVAAPPADPVPSDTGVATLELETAAARFGLTLSDLAPFSLQLAGRRKLYLVNPDHQPPLEPQPDATGLLLMRTGERIPKLSTAAVQLLGNAARQNVIEVDLGQAQAYLHRQVINVSLDQAWRCPGSGFVLIRHRGFTLGVGMLEPDSTGGQVGSLFPKGWSPGSHAGAFKAAELG
jgi:NOL1/NOP2/sun family putative RNA methylase